MPGRGSDNGSDVGDSGTFQTHRDEGEHFVHVKQFDKAIQSFNKAIELNTEDKNCLISRAKCWLQLGNAENALIDAETALDKDKEFIRGLFVKAEALYQRGDFETALVFFHRGFKLRPELEEFRLGIQKAQEAITNSIGTPDSVKLEAKGDLTFFYKQEESKKAQQKGTYSKPGAKKETKKERERPKSAADKKTIKHLLGELYGDKRYLEKLLEDDSLTAGQTIMAREIKGDICDGLEYLNSRADFWRQQKPMYARKRDKERMQRGFKSRTHDPTTYILKCLEDIDDAQTDGKYEDSLTKAKKTLKYVENMSDDEIQNRQEILANLHSQIGNAYLELSKFNQSLEHHNMDLKIAKDNDLEDARSRALDNMGRVYARKGDFERAVEVWEEKLPLSKSPLESTWLYHEIGRCHLELGKYSDARDYGEKSLGAAKDAEDEGWQLHASVLVAQSEVKLGDLQAAAESFERSLEMAKKLNDSPAENAIKKALEEVNDKIVRGVKDGDDQEDDRGSNKSREGGESRQSELEFERDHTCGLSSSLSIGSRNSLAGEYDMEESPIYNKESPVKESPVQKSPLKESVVRDSPLRESPVRKSPLKDSYGRESPVKEPFVRRSPTKDSLLTESPTMKSPMMGSPMQDSQVKEPPKKESPVKESLVRESPVKESPTRESPMKESPAGESAVKESSIKETIERESPVRKSPVKETSAKESPVSESPITESPVKELPIKESTVIKTSVNETENGRAKSELRTKERDSISGTRPKSFTVVQESESFQQTSRSKSAQNQMSPVVARDQTEKKEEVRKGSDKSMDKISRKKSRESGNGKRKLSGGGGAKPRISQTVEPANEKNISVGIPDITSGQQESETAEENKLTTVGQSDERKNYSNQSNLEKTHPDQSDGEKKVSDMSDGNKTDLVFEDQDDVVAVASEVFKLGKGKSVLEEKMDIETEQTDKPENKRISLKDEKEVQNQLSTSTADNGVFLTESTETEAKTYVDESDKDVKFDTDYKSDKTQCPQTDKTVTKEASNVSGKSNGTAKSKSRPSDKDLPNGDMGPESPAAEDVPEVSRTKSRQSDNAGTVTKSAKTKDECARIKSSGSKNSSKSGPAEVRAKSSQSSKSNKSLGGQSAISNQSKGSKQSHDPARVKSSRSQASVKLSPVVSRSLSSQSKKQQLEDGVSRAKSGQSNKSVGSKDVPRLTSRQSNKSKHSDNASLRAKSSQSKASRHSGGDSRAYSSQSKKSDGKQDAERVQSSQSKTSAKSVGSPNSRKSLQFVEMEDIAKEPELVQEILDTDKTLLQNGAVKSRQSIASGAPLRSATVSPSKRSGRETREEMSTKVAREASASAKGDVVSVREATPSAKGSQGGKGSPTKVVVEQDADNTQQEADGQDKKSEPGDVKDTKKGDDDFKDTTDKDED